MALLAMCIVISAASAVDLANDFKSNDFTVKVASGTDFTETVHVSTNDMNFMIFENSDKNSKEVAEMRKDLKGTDTLVEFERLYKSKKDGEGFHSACKLYNAWKKENKNK